MYLVERIGYSYLTLEQIRSTLGLLTKTAFFFWLSASVLTYSQPDPVTSFTAKCFDGDFIVKAHLSNTSDGIICYDASFSFTSDASAGGPVAIWWKESTWVFRENRKCADIHSTAAHEVEVDDAESIIAAWDNFNGGICNAKNTSKAAKD